MTKEELVVIVDQVYAAYNQTLYEKDKTATYRAWYGLLEDLDKDEVWAAFLNLAVYEKFMPRPGDIRRATIDAQTKVPPHLDGYSAWGIFMTLQKNAHYGTPTEISVPEALRKTLERLGEAANSMHTNGDREVFLKTYEAVVLELDRHKYKISENAGRAQAFDPFLSKKSVSVSPDVQKEERAEAKDSTPEASQSEKDQVS